MPVRLKHVLAAVVAAGMFALPTTAGATDPFDVVDADVAVAAFFGEVEMWTPLWIFPTSTSSIFVVTGPGAFAFRTAEHSVKNVTCVIRIAATETIASATGTGTLECSTDQWGIATPSGAPGSFNRVGTQAVYLGQAVLTKGPHAGRTVNVTFPFSLIPQAPNWPQRYYLAGTLEADWAQVNGP